MYTSYFSMMRKFPKELVPVAICRGIPDWYTGLNYEKLAPTMSILKDYRKSADTHNYTLQYWLRVLKNLDIVQVSNELMALCSSASLDNICLLCYERPDEFCHRHLVAQWLMSSGVECKELELYRRV
jgi:hypothetical protein